MHPKTYSLVCGIIFFLIFCGQLLQFFAGFSFEFGDYVMPVWSAWIGAIVFGFLAIQGFDNGGFFDNRKK